MSVHGNFKNATVYLVGGFVRDHFMGVVPKDKDYVVVGSSPEEMIALGFTQVGTDFPVFLHPVSKDEYALARTERKTGTGHQGFTCDWEGVTLEEDLSRRDLTINAIAWDCSKDFGKVYDPFNGIKDIKNKILRPVSPAFKEDPLRCLRVARFSSRYPDFKLSFRLVQCMTDVYNNGALDTLTPERVWKEMEKSFHSKRPSNFFIVGVKRLGMFDIMSDMINTPQRGDHHPEGNVCIHTLMVMDYAAKEYSDPEIIFASLCHDFGKPICHEKYGNAHGHEKEGLPIIRDFCDKWKVPNRFRNLALLVCEHHTKIHGVFGRNTQGWPRPKSIMALFEATGAMKNPNRFIKILKCCIADARGRGAGKEQIAEFEARPYDQYDYLCECLEAVLNTDTKSISARMLTEGKKGSIIGETIRQEQIKAIRGVQNDWKQKVK